MPFFLCLAMGKELGIHFYLEVGNEDDSRQVWAIERNAVWVQLVMIDNLSARSKSYDQTEMC